MLEKIKCSKCGMTNFVGVLCLTCKVQNDIRIAEALQGDRDSDLEPTGKEAWEAAEEEREEKEMERQAEIDDYNDRNPDPMSVSHAWAEERGLDHDIN